VTANSRVPRAVAGDLNAEVAGARTGAAALRRLVDRHGQAIFSAAVEEMFDRGEAAVRSFISTVPDGRYRASGEMDGDGVVDEAIPFDLTVEISGSAVVVDFRDAPDARQGPVNSPLPSTVSAARVAISMLASASDAGGEGHFHEGHFRPIHVEAATALPPSAIPRR
jgi:N-methylhydantoinase B